MFITFIYYFQALIYPLTVAAKSSVVARSQAAEKILKNMREHSANLVQQAMMVSYYSSLKEVFALEIESPFSQFEYQFLYTKFKQYEYFCNFARSLYKMLKNGPRPVLPED